MIDKQLIEKYCLQDNLETYDPYDIWKTKLGFWIKNGFNKNKYLFIFPAAIFTLFDIFINNKFRLFYKKQEYPVVRAFAALSLLNLYKKDNKQEYIVYAKKHIDWLLNNYSTKLKGYGWGIMFDYPVKKEVIYDKNAALTTITPYVLEAIFNLYQITKNKKYINPLKSIYTFFDKDVKIIEETSEYLITSYGTFKDRAVINSVSYTMYSLALLLDFLSGSEKEETLEKINKLYNFIVLSQNPDGSWFYDYKEKDSFIDCFHSAFVLKNLIKTSKLIDLKQTNKVVENGFNYIMNNFFDKKNGLFKRFSLSNKPSLIKFDLYDNAEMLNLLVLLQKRDLSIELNKNIETLFIKNNNIYSSIDIFNVKKNKNTLRWASMPYLYALSKLDLYEKN